MKVKAKKLKTFVEPALAVSELRYRRLFETAQDGILILDAHTGAIKDVNPFLINMLGYSRDEFINKKLWEVGAFRDVQASKDAFAALQNEKYIRYEDLPLKAKDGHLVQVEFVSNVYSVNSHNVIQCNIRDITKRKHAEKQSREHEARYRLLFESASMGILLVDTQGKIQEVSPAALQILGSPSAEATGEINLLTFRPLIEAGISADFQKVMDSAKPVIGEYPYTTKWGKSIFITLKFAPLFGANGNLEQIQVIVEDTTERKQAEALTAASEIELRSLFASMTDAVMVLDDDGRYLKIAPTNPTNLYHSPDRMLGKTVHEIFPQEQAEYIVAKIREAIQTGQVVPGKYALQIGGKETWFASNATRISENTAMWVAHDFTQRKSDEEALLHRAEIMDQVHEAIIVTDLNGLISEWNLGAETMFGYSAEEAVGKPVSSIYVEDQRSLIEGKIQPRVRQVGWDETETRLRRKSGQEFPAHLLLAALKDSKGQITGYAGSALDITERKAAEEAIRKASLYNRSLIEASLDPLVIIGPDGTITDVNASTETATGFKRNELIGTDFSDYFTEPDKARRGYQQVFHDGYIRDYPLEIKHRDGHVIPVLYNATVLHDEQGNVIGVFAAARDITERHQAEHAIHQRFVELATLYASGLALSRLLSPKEIGEKLIELMGSEMNWHHTAIRLYHPEDEFLELLAFNLPGSRTTAEVREVEQRLKSMISKTGEGLSGWAVQHQQNVRVGELSLDPRFVSVESNIHSGMYIPLKVEDRVVGVISIESEIPDAFSDTDERLTATLANQAAIALENARLHEETLHQLKQLQALHIIDETIAQSFDQRLMLDVLLTQTLNQLDVEAAAVFRVQFHHQQALEYVAGKGFITHIIEMASLKLGNSIAGEAVARRKMVHVCEPEESRPQPLLSKLWLEEGFKCMDVVPLISKGEVKGVITVFHRKDFTPDPAWNSFLGTLAGQAAIAMDITQMFDSLQRANMELSIAYEATIEGWSQAMDLRDKETEGHTLRVTEMSQRLAKAMQLGDEEINHMRRGALLHDIGKLGVPDSILFKPDKLTDEEWLVMRKHPEFAYDMLHSIAYLRDSMDIPYCHHEKWDGTGYPQGLKGDQIPLAARIFAVVDVWDALTSDRPYRKAWSKPDTLQYIREQSGKHFDPKVVDVFLKEFVNE